MVRLDGSGEVDLGVSGLRPSIEVINVTETREIVQM